MTAAAADHQQQQQRHHQLLEQLDAIPVDQLAQLTVPLGTVCHALLRALAGNGTAMEEAKRVCPSPDFANAINSAAVNSLRHGIEPEELACQIHQLNSISSSDGQRKALRNAFLEAYRSNFDQLKSILMASVGGVYPKMIGMDWSILSVIESTEGADIEEPLAEITFQTILPCHGQQLGPGGAHQQQQSATELFKFVCNKNQLQDFHGKVTEACNFIQKLASNEK